MIIYEPTEDTAFINKCVTCPTVWRVSIDDGLINVIPSVFFVPTDGKLWLRAGDYGLFMGEPRNSITYEVHTMLLPHARGKAADIARGAIRWIFDNTECRRIITSVPKYNRLAERLAIKCNMELIGTNRNSFLKDGILHDQLLFGISEEHVCQYHSQQ